jgi:MOSC domain-containing protein YiiM
MAAKASVVSIYLGETGGGPLRPVASARVIPGKGLEGDRYAGGAGTYSGHPGSGRHVTLIESEALEALERDYGIQLPGEASRRNLVTRGVALNHLVGLEFTVGPVRLRGTRLCEPCTFLESLVGKPVMKGLIHRGGLRAEVVEGGEIRVGDIIKESS